MADNLLDPYMPTDIPGVNIDPETLRRAKMMALIQSGLGMAQNPNNPAGAFAAGINSYQDAQVQARRDMLANLQAYAERQKIEATARQQAKEMAFLAKMTPEQRAKYGVTDEVWTALQGSKDPAEKFFGSEFVKPYTLSPGQARNIPGVGNMSQLPDSSGRVGLYAQGASTPGMVMALPGAAQAAAEIKGAETGAQQFNTYQNLGPMGPGGAQEHGYPPVPPALRQFQPPMQTNLSGPQAGPLAQQAQADFARTGGAPIINPNPNSRYGMSPITQSTQTHFGTKSVEDWYGLGKETGEAAALAGSMQAHVGAMRDVMSQPGRPEGKLGPLLMTAQQLGASIGLHTEGLPASELFTALTTQIALTVRNPKGDMGLPGSASNQDFTRLLAAAPNMSQSEKGQKLLVETYGAMSDMAIKKAELWADLNRKAEKGELTVADARQQYTKAIAPYAMEATRSIRAAIAEGEKAAKVTGATAAPSTQNAVRMRQLNAEEEDIRRKLNR